MQPPLHRLSFSPMRPLRYVNLPPVPSFARPENPSRAPAPVSQRRHIFARGPTAAAHGDHQEGTRAAAVPRQVAVKHGDICGHLGLCRTFAAESLKKLDKPKKRRLDEICLERYQQYSRTYIQSWILQGKVFVDGRVVSKAGTPVSDKAIVEIKAEIPKYVCRAGHKLEAAIEHFGIDVSGKVALDSGLSTGGFTDCLLQYGVLFVYGVDVGYGQVATKIRQDERVSILERTNLRHLPGLPQLVDLVTLDLSFISILLVMPAVIGVMKERSILITLVKPQFEARRSQVGGGGIVRDPRVHQEVLEKIISGVEAFGFQSKGWIESPLKGAEGNTEFLVCFQRVHNIGAAKVGAVEKNPEVKEDGDFVLSGIPDTTGITSHPK